MTGLRRYTPLRRGRSLRRVARRVTRRAVTGPSAAVRQMVAERDQHRCVWCGRPDGWTGLQVHHRRPRMAGGSRHPAINQPANLLLLCAEHYDYVESHREEARQLGFLLRFVEDAPRTPVLSWRGWVLLDDDGGVTEVEE